MKISSPRNDNMGTSPKVVEYCRRFWAACIETTVIYKSVSRKKNGILLAVFNMSAKKPPVTQTTATLNLFV